MTNTKWFGIGILIVILGWFIFVRDGGSIIPSPEPTPVPTSVITPSLKEAYLEGCLSEDVSYQYCECTYNYMAENYGEDAIMKLGIGYLKDESSAIEDLIVIQAVLYCQDLL